MNYRHIYHAGNFADVAKHTALCYCLSALKRKAGAFFALDTHAGRGYYPLAAAEAQKSGEAARGILRLIEAGTHEAGLKDYLDAVGVRPGKRLPRYPGSPALIADALRPQDRALFVESEPAEARALEREAWSEGRIRIEIGDGYASLRAMLPPQERRGLVLVDPSYEDPGELSAMLRAFADAYRRWPTGLFLLWYPIVSAGQRAAVHARFAELRIPKMLLADLAVHPDDAGIGLAGSGLVIVNPPYGTDEYLRGAYAAIHRALAPGGAGYAQVTRLSPEQVAQ